MCGTHIKSGAYGGPPFAESALIGGETSWRSLTRAATKDQPNMKAIALYVALDLHSSHSVLGSMDQEGNSQGRVRFATEAESLREQVRALKKKGRALYLTLEAGALSRWAAGIIRPLVDRLIICEPRYNRLINSNPNKCDEADVEGMCLLLRLGRLKEVWM